MALKSVSVAAAAEPDSPSGDSGKDAIDVCKSVWNGAHNQQPEDEKSSVWTMANARIALSTIYNNPKRFPVNDG